MGYPVIGANHNVTCGAEQNNSEGQEAAAEVEMASASKPGGEGSTGVETHVTAEERDEDSNLPLLTNGQPGSEGSEGSEGGVGAWPSLPVMWSELKLQYTMGGTLSLNLFFMYMVSIITLSFLGHIGQNELAAGALAMAICNSLGRLFYMGLCGALDTQASQAFGASRFEALHVIFQRTVLFLAAHAVPVTLACYFAPNALQAIGHDPEECARVRQYVRMLIPSLWLEVLDRPLNRILVAQRIFVPQTFISGAVVVLHAVTCYVLVVVFDLGYLATGAADSLARLYYFALQSCYVYAAGLSGRVWGTPNLRSLSKWGAFAKLAYTSAIMKCVESWCYSGMTVASGLLPDGAASVSAIGVSFSVYGVFFMSFMGVAVSAGTRVGNCLGDRRPGAARVAALTAIMFVPLMWVLVAVVLVEPHSQALLISAFTGASNEALVRRLQVLLRIVAVLELLDGMQTVMSGVISGAGKQARGALINFCAFYGAAIPVALCLAFLTPMGVYGLYTGLILGPGIQCLAYFPLIMRIDWQRESELAASRAALH